MLNQSLPQLKADSRILLELRIFTAEGDVVNDPEQMQNFYDSLLTLLQIAQIDPETVDIVYEFAI